VTIFARRPGPGQASPDHPRGPHEHDGRSHHLILTAEGERLFADVRPGRRRVRKGSCCRALPPKKINTFKTLLRRVGRRRPPGPKHRLTGKEEGPLFARPCEAGEGGTAAKRWWAGPFNTPHASTCPLNPPTHDLPATQFPKKTVCAMAQSLAFC